MALFDYYSLITPASLFCLFFFLPITLCIYYMVPQKMRSAVLFLISFCYLVFVQKQVIPALAICIFSTYLSGQGILRYSKNSFMKNFFFMIGIFINLFVFVMAGGAYQLGQVPALIGISVTPLLCLWHLNSCWLEQRRATDSIWTLGASTLFFPKLYGGALELGTYQEDSSPFNNLLEGFGPMARGTFKLAYLGRNIWILSDNLRPLATESTLGAWFLVISFGFALFFTLSGFCELAQGISAFFGIKISRSFRYPFQSTSLTDFSKRFHFSLRILGENAVYDRLYSEKHTAFGKPLCFILTGMTVGLWYGFSANFFIWGAFWGLLLALEDRFSILKRLPVVVGWLYCMLFYFLSLVWMIQPQLDQVFPLYTMLFSFRANPNPDALAYQFVNSWFLIALGIFCSTSISHHLRGAVRQLWGKIGKWFVVLIDVVILIVAVATMT